MNLFPCLLSSLFFPLSLQVQAFDLRLIHRSTHPSLSSAGAARVIEVAAFASDSMGQVPSKDVDSKQLQRIIDHIFEYFTSHSGHDYLAFQELYLAILLIYNDINKHFPGPHYDPPTREQVQEMLKTFDTNKNGLLDRSEFNAFVKKFTANIASRISKNILIFSILVPGLALLTKKATEKVPVVGPVVRKVPSAIYASLITAVVAVVGKVNGSS